MKTLKSMSIIGIVLFSLSLFFITMYIDEDDEAAIGWGIIGVLYALAYSIVVLVKSNKKPNPEVNARIVTSPSLNTSEATPPPINSQRTTPPPITAVKEQRQVVDITDQLLKLNELKEKGILTEDEFQMKKKEILNI